MHIYLYLVNILCSTMMKNHVILVLSFSLLASCKTLEYDSSYYTSEEKALNSIERLIKSQGDKFTPNSLEITNEYVAYSKEYREGGSFGWYGGGASTVNRSNSLYFDMIDRIVFVKKKGHYEIRVHSKASNKWKLFFCWDFEIAQKGVNGFAYMMQNAKSVD
jgi:hypothetical protein